MEVIKGVAATSLMLGMGLTMGGCATGSAHTKSITVAEARGGRGVEVAVSQALARQILEGAIGSELRCRGEVDDEFGSLLRALDERGPGSRASIRRDDGVLRAHRTRRALELELRDRDGGGEIDAVLPWALAECMLGRSTRLDADVADVRLTVRGEGGGTFELRVD